MVTKIKEKRIEDTIFDGSIPEKDNFNEEIEENIEVDEEPEQKNEKNTVEVS
jgi:hypothetical protein